MLGSILQGNTTEALVFGPVILASDHITGAIGISLTVTISKNGGAFAAPVGAVSEIGFGWYKIAAAAADADTVGLLAIHATGAGCDPYDEKYDVITPGVASSLASPSSTVSGVNITALQLIHSALRLLGVIGEADVASGAMAEDSLRVLNELVDAWALEELMLYSTTRSEYALTGGTQTYTIGPGATFNQARPVAIDYARLIIRTNPAQPIEVPLALYTPQEWAGIGLKNLSTEFPRGIYNDFAAPLSTLSFWPIPSNSTHKVALYWRAIIGEFADLFTTYTFPYGYARALRFNLALDLAPEYGKEIPAIVAARAVESKAAIKRRNDRPELLVCDQAFLSRDTRWDIQTGDYL